MANRINIIFEIKGIQTIITGKWVWKGSGWAIKVERGEGWEHGRVQKGNWRKRKKKPWGILSEIWTDEWRNLKFNQGKLNISIKPERRDNLAGRKQYPVEVEVWWIFWTSQWREIGKSSAVAWSNKAKRKNI